MKVSDPAGPPVHAPDLVFERVEPQRVLDRHRQPLRADRLDHEVDGTGPHGADHRIDRAVRGLHDGRDRDLAFAKLRQHLHAVDLGHHQIENQQVDGLGVGRGEPAQGLGAALDDVRLVTEPPHHRLEQTALHRIVVDYEDSGRHASSNKRHQIRTCGACWAMTVNGRLTPLPVGRATCSDIVCW